MYLSKKYATHISKCKRRQIPSGHSRDSPVITTRPIQSTSGFPKAHFPAAPHLVLPGIPEASLGCLSPGSQGRRTAAPVKPTQGPTGTTGTPTSQTQVRPAFAHRPALGPTSLSEQNYLGFRLHGGAFPERPNTLAPLAGHPALDPTAPNSCSPATQTVTGQAGSNTPAAHNQSNESQMQRAIPYQRGCGQLNLSSKLTMWVSLTEKKP